MGGYQRVELMSMDVKILPTLILIKGLQQEQLTNYCWHDIPVMVPTDPDGLVVLYQPTQEVVKGS
jgi:hypothetical protein